MAALDVFKGFRVSLI